MAYAKRFIGMTTSEMLLAPGRAAHYVILPSRRIFTASSAALFAAVPDAIVTTLPGRAGIMRRQHPTADNRERRASRAQPPTVGEPRS
jgi:hypothetical protein